MNPDKVQPSFAFHCVLGSPMLTLWGSAFRFAYHASGCNVFVGLLLAVNESVYEHLKLLIFAMLLWWLVVTPLFGTTPRNYRLLALTASVCVASVCGCVCIALPCLLISVWNGVMWFDILLFSVASFLGQCVGWKMLKQFTELDQSDWIATPFTIVAVMLLAMYMTFTYYPPHIKAIFQDSSNASSAFYGVPLRC
jgi:hypothetical protein